MNSHVLLSQTGLSHACANGFMPILEILAQVSDVDVNMADNDGNTPLIFAACADHAEVVNFLLHNFRRVRIDQTNHLGFTALMKAAINGRERAAKILIFAGLPLQCIVSVCVCPSFTLLCAGANPNKRDFGRTLCALEWAKFCGRQRCSESIQKCLNSKKYLLKKTFMLSRWNSEPDLPSRKQKVEQQKDKHQGNWIQRHLSFKKKKRSRLESTDSSDSPSPDSPLANDKRTSSSPILITTGPEENHNEAAARAAHRRPSSIEGVVPLNIFQNRRRPAAQAAGGEAPLMEALVEDEIEPPTIVETDYDAGK